MCDHWKDLIIEHPKLDACTDDVKAALDLLVGCVSHGNKVLTCGNGGSAADSEHIVG